MRSSILLIAAVAAALAACGPSDSDKLDDNELATAAGGARAEIGTRCGVRATQDELRRQLFARAAEIRGSNAPDYARIAEFAVLQLDDAGPVDATSSSALADCRARATLRLPSGLRVAGGRTTLSGDIVYSVAVASGGSVTLGQADAIAIPLATLTQRRAVPPVPPAEQSGEPEAVIPPPQEDSAPPQPDSPEPSPPPETSSARASFDCRRARTSGELAVCADPALADLDRAMAEQYRSAYANGGPAERRLLVQTRDRFLAFRDRCDNDNCIARTYRGRMREIDDIVAGRWQAPR